jgi:hypothetical protein
VKLSSNRRIGGVNVTLLDPEGYWILVIGYWLLVTGYWLLVTGYWLLVTGYWLHQDNISHFTTTRKDTKTSSYIRLHKEMNCLMKNIIRAL